MAVVDLLVGRLILQLALPRRTSLPDLGPSTVRLMPRKIAVVCDVPVEPLIPSKTLFPRRANIILPDKPPPRLSARSVRPTHDRETFNSRFPSSTVDADTRLGSTPVSLEIASANRDHTRSFAFAPGSLRLVARAGTSPAYGIVNLRLEYTAPEKPLFV